MLSIEFSQLQIMMLENFHQLGILGSNFIFCTKV